MQDTLGAQQILALLAQHHSDPLTETLHAERCVRGKAHQDHGAVVLVVVLPTRKSGSLSRTRPRPNSPGS